MIFLVFVIYFWKLFIFVFFLIFIFYFWKLFIFIFFPCSFSFFHLHNQLNDFIYTFTFSC